MGSRERTGWKQRLVLIGFGALLVALAEGALRLLWAPPARDEAFRIATRIRPYEVREGVARTRRGFVGAFRPVEFPAEKPRGAFRVFCLGGSTTFGYPYRAEVAWPAVLERRLHALYPDRRFEVINAGATSYGSARVLGVLRTVLEYRPDGVVVCCGDAEFVEDSYRTAIETREEGVAGWARSLYLARALALILPRRPGPPAAVDAEDVPASAFLFAPVLDGTVYSPSPARRREVLERFRNNLEEMVRLARGAGVRLLLATVPSNVRSWPPDPSPVVPLPPGKRARWEGEVAEGRRLAQRQAWQAAARRYEAALEVWDGDATVWYELGLALRRAGLARDAKIALERARDLDPAPVRAASAFNDAIREAAGPDLVDLEREFVSGLPDHIVDDRLILDYAHPNPRGHQLIARATWEAMRRRGWVPEVSAPGAEEAFREGEAGRAAGEPEGDANLLFVWGQIYRKKGQDEKAVEFFRKAIRSGYDLPYVYTNLGEALFRLGREGEAFETLRVLEERYPDFREADVLLATVYARRGDLDRAAAYLRRALAARPGERRIALQLVDVLEAKGDYRGADAAIAEALRASPGDCELLARRGLLRESSGDPAAAEREYRDLLARDPDCQWAWEDLGVLLMNQGRWAEARDTFSTAARRAGDAWPLHRLNLGWVYWRGFGDRVSAVREFRAYHAMAPEDVDRIPEPLRREVLEGEP